MTPSATETNLKISKSAHAFGLKVYHKGTNINTKQGKG